MFIAEKNEFIKNRYVISTNPVLYEVSQMEGIDIDTEYDYELAKLILKNKDQLIKYDKK